MTVGELAKLIDAENLTPSLTLDREVTGGYTCDLLSWVMAHGNEGMAWITVQTHLNVIAVAVLMEMAVVIIPERIAMEEASIQKAVEEGMVVLSSRHTAYDICGMMVGAGLA